VPELPEVETIRSDLALRFIGLRLEMLKILGERTIRRNKTNLEEVGPELLGRQLSDAKRYGKYLILELSGSQIGEISYLVVHLGMSGRFVLQLPEMPNGRDHTKMHVRFSEEDLYLWDPRTFGEVFLETGLDDLGRPMTLSKRLGIDPYLYPHNVAGALGEVAVRSSRAIKAVLLDQKVIAGLGNIYSDEVLFRSRVSPSFPVSALDKRGIERVAEAVVEVVNKAVVLRGSSLKDKSYMDLSGRPGSYQSEHLVYGRYSKACMVCGEDIDRVLIAGRYSSFCSICQQGADRWDYS
jgi:formamidopyrimidine-DNA glycosylase